MQNNKLRNALQLAIIALYTVEFITLADLTIGAFFLCLLSGALLLSFFLLLMVMISCECFDEYFGLKSFVRRKHHHLLTLKLVLVVTLIGMLGIHYRLHPVDVEHVAAEVWVILLSEVVTYALVELKNHIENNRKKE